MDNGEVIPGLNEDWMLAGAKLSEWVCGFMAFIICSEVIFTDKMARSMPLLLLVGAFTVFSMAALRRTFPDEERGIRNAAMTAVGVEPPGIPTPAALQPIWSGAPVRQLKATSKFRRYGLDLVFDGTKREMQDEDLGGFQPGLKSIGTRPVKAEAKVVKEVKE